jgi:hypothetical protein
LRRGASTPHFRFRVIRLFALAPEPSSWKKSESSLSISTSVEESITQGGLDVMAGIDIGAGDKLSFSWQPATAGCWTRGRGADPPRSSQVPRRPSREILVARSYLVTTVPAVGVEE